MTGSAVRHKAPTRARVLELWAAGWKPAEIQRVLEREGLPVPSRNTIWVWTHPRKAAKQAQRDRQVSAIWRVERASFAWPGVRTDQWKAARMSAMRRAGVSCGDIARVMALDFPDDPRLSDDQVRYRLFGDPAQRRPPGRCETCDAELPRRPGRRPKHCDDCKQGAVA